MFLISRVIILLNEAKIFLPFPLQGQLPPLGVGWEIALWTGRLVRWDRCWLEESLIFILV